jgi:hypothetical protein
MADLTQPYSGRCDHSVSSLETEPRPPSRLAMAAVYLMGAFVLYTFAAIAVFLIADVWPLAGLLAGGSH